MRFLADDRTPDKGCGHVRTPSNPIGPSLVAPLPLTKDKLRGRKRTVVIVKRMLICAAALAFFSGGIVLKVTLPRELYLPKNTTTVELWSFESKTAFLDFCCLLWRKTSVKLLAWNRIFCNDREPKKFSFGEHWNLSEDQKYIFYLTMQLFWNLFCE